jgi:gamma-glutamylcyclotransferase (GGCT)/AIG2-like uncharacterized protein YtfP
MNPHLFVYGSLLSAAGHRMGRRLVREARLIGTASLPGRLYRLGAYPGMVCARGRARVHGEVYALDDPMRSFAWLDVYEGLAAAAPGEADYARRERTVSLAEGQQVRCWVYLYCKDVSALPTVAGGRWLDALHPCKPERSRQNS